MSQIALPLDSGDAAPSRIVVGAGNRRAVDALSQPHDWPFRTAVLLGPPRSGKSLLARWFEAQGHGEAIDGAQDLDETQLFHRWNRAQEDGHPLLLVADGDAWEIALPDLASRLGGSLQLAITAPDDAMVAELIAAHAEQRRLALADGAAHYLVPRLTRSYAAIERVVAEIDRISLERKAPATLSIWRDALDAVEGPEQARLL
ncbi:ATPase [Erythrobacter sp. QSSC1-22B]|uniref:HdaA/DnaA family protein n=1 Tax=Erythrobacter sp. QSSC1-22B TaxID=1860125 RepID=UPI0008052C2E|nr:ATPase [Erythrobacter sp. QSSC1-22B]OBX20750.1 ATPase [Erythrobacter sp. QSSC1-22B]